MRKYNLGCSFCVETEEGVGQGREKKEVVGKISFPHVGCYVLSQEDQGRLIRTVLNFFPLSQKLSASLSSILSSSLLSRRKTYSFTLPRCTAPPGLLIPSLPDQR